MVAPSGFRKGHAVLATAGKALVMVLRLVTAMALW